MGPKDIVAVDIAEAQPVKLLGVTLAREIDGDEDWPRQTGTKQADVDNQAEKAEVEIGIEGGVLQDKLVAELEVVIFEKLESRSRGDRCSVLLGNGLKESSRSVDLPIPRSDDDKYGQVDDSNGGGRYDSCEYGGSRTRARVAVAAEVLLVSDDYILSLTECLPLSFRELTKGLARSSRCRGCYMKCSSSHVMLQTVQAAYL